MRRVSTYTSSATTQDIQMAIASWAGSSWVDIDTTKSVWTNGARVSVTTFTGSGGSQNGTVLQARSINLDNLNWMFWDSAGSNVLSSGTTIRLPASLVGKVVAVRKQLLQYGSVDNGQPTWGTIDFLTVDPVTNGLSKTLTPTVIWDAAALETAAATAASRPPDTTITAIGRVLVPSYMIFTKSTQDPRGAAVDCSYNVTVPPTCELPGCGKTGYNVYDILNFASAQYDGAACQPFHGYAVTGNGKIKDTNEPCYFAACPVPPILPPAPVVVPPAPVVPPSNPPSGSYTYGF